MITPEAVISPRIHLAVNDSVELTCERTTLSRYANADCEASNNC